MTNVFSYLKSHKQALSADYPYAKKTEAQTCDRTNESKYLDLKITGSDAIKARYEDLLEAVAIQPVSISVHAGQDPFMKYEKGVLKGCPYVQADHGISIVGYDTDKVEGLYFLVRNSWGERWGEKGYIRITAEAATLPNGEAEVGCGILLGAAVPTFSK